MITPTTGRVVYFWPDVEAKKAGDKPHAAIVADVINDRLVNLAVFTKQANLRPTLSVPLLQDDDQAPATGHFAEWMPYQLKAASGVIGQTPRLLHGGPEGANAVAATAIPLGAVWGPTGGTEAA